MNNIRNIRNYREILIDSHIADWNKVFQSKFSPKNYVDMLSLANVSSAMIYVTCHNGICYYPTKIGHQHNNIRGKDIVGEIIDFCNKKNIIVVLYYSLIYNKWVYDNYPDWRIINAGGIPTGEKMRYGVVCPNSGYRDFAVRQINEICSRYEFSRIFFDMTFWPDVCYCRYCEERFKKETGWSLPRVINWENEKWVTFQRKREEWMKDFAAYCTSEVRKVKPGAGVTHQFSTSLWDWKLGVPFDIVDECDYTSGDFYGDSTRHSLACKVFMDMTKTKPFEFFVSRCINLYDHTTLKSGELMEAQALQVIGHSGRIIFIDAINPDGTLEKGVFKKIGKIYREVKKYEAELGGELMQDVGIYFSHESKISLEDNGKDVAKTGASFSSTDIPHFNAIVNTCKTLMGNHVPFGIVSKKDLRNLSKYRLIILPNVMMMDEDEVNAFKDYVRNGGSIYASKFTSLFDKYKGKKDNFMLSELLGVSYDGITDENVTYISTKGGALKHVTDLTIFREQVKVKLIKGKVLATLTLPYTNPKDLKKFASIHSNPPGIRTAYPAVVLNEYGAGKVCYVSGELELSETDIHREVFMNILTILTGNKFFFEVEAPKSVEILVFKHPEKYIINLVNFQNEMPNIPVRDIKVKIRIPSEEKPVKLVLVPENKSCICDTFGRRSCKGKFKLNKNILEFIVPELRTFKMYKIIVKRRSGK